jgi:hypothetical protein
MNRRIAVALAASVAVAPAGAALAQSPSPSTARTASPAAVKAAQDATREAKAVTFALLDRSTGTNVGTVTLRRIGGTRSRVTVTLTNPSAGEPRVTLRTGHDCLEPRVANAPHGPILLNPFTGRTSETIVNLPLTNLQSGNYLLDVQDATARQQAVDACARISPGGP